MGRPSPPVIRWSKVLEVLREWCGWWASADPAYFICSCRNTRET
jgi:hypothetical protein